MIAQRDAVDPFHGQDIVRGAVPVDGGHAKIRIVAGIFRHLGERGSLQPQVHLHRHRARHRIDDLDQPQPPRFRRIDFGLVRDKEEIGEVAAEARRPHWAAAPSPRPRCARRCARFRRDAPARSRRRRPRGRSSQTPAPAGVPATARSRLRPRLAGTAAAGPAGFPDRAPSSRRPRRAGWRETVRASDRPVPAASARATAAGRIWRRGARRCARASARAGRAAAPGSDRPRRTRLRARTRNRRGRAARCG